MAHRDPYNTNNMRRDSRQHHSGGRGGGAGGGSHRYSGGLNTRASTSTGSSLPECLQLDALNLFGRAPSYRDEPDYRVNRPPTRDPGERNFTYYALVEDNQTRISGAFGIEIRQTEVEVRLAYLDIESTLGREGFPNFWAHASKMQLDFHGARPKGAKEAHFCEGDFIHHNLALLPIKLKKAAPGLSEEKPSFVVVLAARFPRGEGDKRNVVDWSSPAEPPTFRRSAVQVDSQLKDRDVKGQTAAPAANARYDSEEEDEEEEGLDAGGVEVELSLLEEFCAYQAFGSGRHATYADVFKHAEGIPMSNTPQFDQEKQQLAANSRPLMTRRRFILDTCTDYFNDEAVRAIAAAEGPSSHDLMGRQWAIPEPLQRCLRTKETIEAKGLSLRSAFEPFGLPLRQLAFTLPPAFVLQSAKTFRCNTATTLALAKFNVPLREFSSVYNLKVLTDVVVDRKAAVAQPSSWDHSNAKARLTQMLRQERGKLIWCYSGVSNGAEVYHTARIRIASQVTDKKKKALFLVLREAAGPSIMEEEEAADASKKVLPFEIRYEK